MTTNCQSCGKECSSTFSNATNEVLCTRCESKYRGVGGWLLLYCLILVVIQPLMNLLMHVQGYQEIRPLFGQFPGLRSGALLVFLIVIGMSIFSISAGIALLSRRSNAVTLARAYMATMIPVYILAGLVPLFTTSNLPAGAAPLLIKEAFLSGGRAVVFQWIWGSYLTKSKRVRATYGDAGTSSREVPTGVPSRMTGSVEPA